MIQLTPLEETTAVKELLHIKETEASIKGELIGTIITLQRVMKLTLAQRELLMKQSIEQLQTILAKLEAKFQ